jgi:hypothetical protein
MFSGYTNIKSTGFVKAIGGLSASGHVMYPGPGDVALTESGRALAAPAAQALTTADVHARASELIGGAASRILGVVIDAYPNSIERQALAEKTNYGNIKSTGFVKAIGRLSTLGFVTYPGAGQVRAGDVLFP